LKNLCEFLKIPLKKVVAVGDQMNDLSMIKIAGYGVAMEMLNKK
jgi:hydroxymethylpyrimidine pyrophosphatase-like HAD family hydrolase